MSITGHAAELMFLAMPEWTYIIDGALAMPWHVIAERSQRIDIIGFACSDFGCCHLASHRIYWPGQTSLKCPRHVDGWSRVALEMGFELQAKSIDTATGNDDWARRISMLEFH